MGRDCARIRARGRHIERGVCTGEIGPLVESTANDKLNSLITETVLQLRLKLDLELMRTAMKRTSATMSQETSEARPMREQCAADFGAMVKEIYATRGLTRSTVKTWNTSHDGACRTSRKQVRKCLELLRKDINLGCALEEAFVPFNIRGWHRRSLSKESDNFLAEGIAGHLSNCNLIFKEDVLCAAHALLKLDCGDHVNSPTEGWYTGFVQRHKKRCKIVDASRLAWVTTENLHRWYLDKNTSVFTRKGDSPGKSSVVRLS